MFVQRVSARLFGLTLRRDYARKVVRAHAAASVADFDNYADGTSMPAHVAAAPAAQNNTVQLPEALTLDEFLKPDLFNLEDSKYLNKTHARTRHSRYRQILKAYPRPERQKIVNELKKTHYNEAMDDRYVSLSRKEYAQTQKFIELLKHLRTHLYPVTDLAACGAYIEAVRGDRLTKSFLGHLRYCFETELRAIKSKKMISMYNQAHGMSGLLFDSELQSFLKWINTNPDFKDPKDSSPELKLTPTDIDAELLRSLGLGTDHDPKSFKSESESFGAEPNSGDDLSEVIEEEENMLNLSSPMYKTFDKDATFMDDELASDLVRPMKTKQVGTFFFLQRNDKLARYKQLGAILSSRTFTDLLTRIRNQVMSRAFAEMPLSKAQISLISRELKNKHFLFRGSYSDSFLDAVLNDATLLEHYRSHLYKQSFTHVSDEASGESLHALMSSVAKRVLSSRDLINFYFSDMETYRTDLNEISDGIDLLENSHRLDMPLTEQYHTVLGLLFKYAGRLKYPPAHKQQLELLLLRLSKLPVLEANRDAVIQYSHDKIPADLQLEIQAENAIFPSHLHPTPSVGLLRALEANFDQTRSCIVANIQTISELSRSLRAWTPARVIDPRKMRDAHDPETALLDLEVDSSQYDDEKALKEYHELQTITPFTRRFDYDTYSKSRASSKDTTETSPPQNIEIYG